MGFFDKLFGRTPATSPAAEREPPEFARAVELQRAYWTYDAEEHGRLAAAGELSWPERLRLHHLNCLRRLAPVLGGEDADEPCRQSARALLAADSPYRPRAAMVWQGPAGGREPDLQGTLLNPSLTHLGAFEVYRVDADHRPTRLDFVAFDELAGVAFGPRGLVRAAKLFHDDGRGEVVLAPLLYGLTWEVGTEFDRAGRMTRFLAHLDGEELGSAGASGVGVGQQDLSVRGPDGATLFGLGSVAEVAFPLDMRDPRFDAKARARGIDPDEVRRTVGGA